ncbi:MAG: CbiX/SirB N-terminal domain-containing protein [Phycisphaerales bacterium]
MMTDSTMFPRGVNADQVGVIVVDHGSRRAESNDMLLDVVAMFERLSEWRIIEPAHMEIAEPTIAAAFKKCVERGAKLVVVHPYFLLPGKHWHTDIPNLTAQAGRSHPGVKWMVTAPLGQHALMAQIMNARITQCLSHVGGKGPECDVCAGKVHCTLHTGD